MSSNGIIADARQRAAAYGAGPEAQRLIELADSLEVADAELQDYAMRLHTCETQRDAAIASVAHANAQIDLAAESRQEWAVRAVKAERERDEALARTERSTYDALNLARIAVVEQMPSAAFGFSDVSYGDAYQDGAEAAMRAIDKLRTAFGPKA